MKYCFPHFEHSEREKRLVRQVEGDTQGAMAEREAAAPESPSNESQNSDNNGNEFPDKNNQELYLERVQTEEKANKAERDAAKNRENLVGALALIPGAPKLTNGIAQRLQGLADRFVSLHSSSIQNPPAGQFELGLHEKAKQTREFGENIKEEKIKQQAKKALLSTPGITPEDTSAETAGKPSYDTKNETPSIQSAAKAEEPASNAFGERWDDGQEALYNMANPERELGGPSILRESTPAKTPIVASHMKNGGRSKSDTYVPSPSPTLEGSYRVTAEKGNSLRFANSPNLDAVRGESTPEPAPRVSIADIPALTPQSAVVSQEAAARLSSSPAPSILKVQPTIPLTTLDVPAAGAAETAAPQPAPTPEQGPPSTEALATAGVASRLQTGLEAFDFSKEGIEASMRNAVQDALKNPNDKQKMMAAIMWTVVATMVNVMSSFISHKSVAPSGSPGSNKPNDTNTLRRSEAVGADAETIERENASKKKDAQERVGTELEERRGNTRKEPMSRVKETGENLATMKEEKTKELQLNAEEIKVNQEAIDQENKILVAAKDRLNALESEGDKNNDSIIAALKNRIKALESSIASYKAMNIALNTASEMLKEDLKVIEDKEAELKSGVGQVKLFLASRKEQLKQQGIEDNIDCKDVVLRLDAKEGFILVLKGPDEQLRQIVQQKIGKDVSITNDEISLTFDQLRKFGIEATKPTV